MGNRIERNIPRHLGIIMDGNRRWARSQGLPSMEGHRRSIGVVRMIIRWCLKHGIKFVTLFAFSTENWQRPQAEVSFLMKLFRSVLRSEISKLSRQKVRYNAIGRLNELSPKLQQAISRAMARTRHYSRLVLNVAINYGGRAEIVDAVKKIITNKVPLSQVTEGLISHSLYDPHIPEPDFIIRTSGEQRLSGFLLWQAAYSELYFSRKLWPEFTEQDLDDALNDYQHRQRRFGK